ncbi:MAG: hypothetical protein ABIG70_09720 [Pseudomonadota bacterium]|jgi:hypothetical protein|nr:hypothetical protein [Gammaproteobacteria bacterium]MBU1733051.1 hypothetical protein [Gammaproteobacteria bacterium]MBU1892099.1 hypothetical protein [Gammaproteobacteria bacterium]
MTQWMSGTFQLGAMLLALLALAQATALADAGPGSTMSREQFAAVGAAPAHLGWMLEQHWRVVDGR